MRKSHFQQLKLRIENITFFVEILLRLVCILGQNLGKRGGFTLWNNYAF
jgi:uncharacterized membrane protein